MPTSARSRRDDAEDVAAGEVALAAARRAAPASAGTRRLRAAYSGLMKLLSRCAGSTRARAGGACPTRASRNLIEQRPASPPARRRPSSGRTPSRRSAAAAPRSRRSRRRHRACRCPSMPWTCTSTKPGTTKLSRDVDDRAPGGVDRGALDRRDASLVDDERCAGEDAVRQDEVAAGEHDHRASMAARAAPSGPPSSPSVAAVDGQRFGHASSADGAGLRRATAASNDRRRPR